MTDFKVGDRVRATLGENVLVGQVVSVKPVSVALALVDAGFTIALFDGDGWHIEKVSQPLPTKWGSVIRRADGEYFTLAEPEADDNAAWYGPFSGWVFPSTASRDGFEVIFPGVDQ